MEQNRKAGQNPPRVVAPTEEEEEFGKTRLYVPHCTRNVSSVRAYITRCPTTLYVLMYLDNYDIAIVAGVAQSGHRPAIGWTTS